MENSIADLNDEQLASAVQRGDADSFGRLVERYQAKMLRYAHKFLLAENSEDAVQEVFIKTYQNIKSFDASQRFSPWIYRIAHNEFINHLKKNGREQLSFFDPDTFFPHPIAKETAESETESGFAKKLVESSLDKLDSKYREVLVLYYLEELSYKEISDILKIPVATVGVRIKRAKEALKVLIKDQVI